MDKRPNTALFDDALCDLIEKYSGDGMLCAGEIVGIMEYVKYKVITKSIKFILDENNDEDYANDGEEWKPK